MSVFASSFVESDIGEIRIFSRDEKKQEEMRNFFNDDRIKFYIGDVRDYESVYSAIRGGEDVFYFMPGLRYFGAFCNIIFGDIIV